MHIVTKRNEMKKLYIAIFIALASIQGCVSLGSAPAAGYNAVRDHAGDVILNSSNETPENGTQVYVPVSRYKW